MVKHKEKSKKHKSERKHKEKKKKKRRDQKSSSSSSSDEWVEKDNLSSSDEETTANKGNECKSESQASSSTNREEWMSLPTSFLTESNIDKRNNREKNKRLESELAQYNPREHKRELNPYWKDGGDGLPKFKKPTNDYDSYHAINRPKTNSNWRKQQPQRSDERRETTSELATSESLSEKELNVLAARVLKAEIMGKTELVKELKTKLEAARNLSASSPSSLKSEDVILTQTDSKGYTRPVRSQATHGEFSGTQTKRKKLETHQDGQRVRYFADDDKYSLQQMFENEKFASVAEQDSEFARFASKIRKSDDLDDMFVDDIRKKAPDPKTDARIKDKAIHEHLRVVKSIDSCKLCLQSSTMPKHLMVTLKETVFISLPSHEPLTDGHCLLVPVRHVSCSTLLDENEWNELTDFRKGLTNMFNAKNEDVIFFESAKHLERYPHMYIECIPINKEVGDTAPIYFKKAIDECESEWAQNKKLISLKGRDVRKAVPKGLSYFFVSFGNDEGFAHVIEDQKMFPSNFAQEIIGGMLDLHHSKWKKPKIESFNEQSRRVLEFSKEWNSFENT